VSRAVELLAALVYLGNPLVAQYALRPSLQQLGPAQLGDQGLTDIADRHDRLFGRVVDRFLVVVGHRGHEAAGNDDSFVLIAGIEALPVVAQGRPDVHRLRVVVVDHPVVTDDGQARRELFAASIRLEQPSCQAAIARGHFAEHCVACGDDFAARLLDLVLLVEIEDLNSQGILHRSSSHCQMVRPCSAHREYR